MTTARHSQETEGRCPRCHPSHPGGDPGANLRSISHRCHPILVAVVWELTEETINLPLGCLQGGQREFFIDNLLVRVHFIIVIIRWTGLAPWEFDFPFLGSLTSTFLGPRTDSQDRAGYEDRIFIEIMISDRKLKASREGSK